MKTEEEFEIKEEEYEPYGEEWAKEVSKAPKKWIVEQLYKPSCIKNTALLKALKAIAKFTPDRSTQYTAEQAIKDNE